MLGFTHYCVWCMHLIYMWDFFLHGPLNFIWCTWFFIFTVFLLLFLMIKLGAHYFFSRSRITFFFCIDPMIFCTAYTRQGHREHKAYPHISTYPFTHYSQFSNVYQHKTCLWPGGGNWSEIQLNTINKLEYVFLFISYSLDDLSIISGSNTCFPRGWDFFPCESINSETGLSFV